MRIFLLIFSSVGARVTTVIQLYLLCCMQELPYLLGTVVLLILLYQNVSKDHKAGGDC